MGYEQNHRLSLPSPACPEHCASQTRLNEFYNALKRQNVVAKMVVYPRTPHGPKEPKFLPDIMQRNLDWVEKYVTP
jgi:hypothetical protein